MPSFFTISSCSASSLFCSTCAQLPVKLSPEPSLALPLSRSLSRSFVLGARWCHVVAHPFVRRPKLDVFFFGTLLLPSASRSLGSASQFGLRLNVHAAVFSGCWCFSKYPPVSKTGTHHLTELPLIKTCRLWSMQRCRASQWANTSPGRNCLNMSITFLSWHQVCECPLAIGLEQTGVAAPQRQVTMLKCYSQAICFYKHHPIFWNILVVYEVSKPTVCIYIYILCIFPTTHKVLWMHRSESVCLLRQVHLSCRNKFVWRWAGRVTGSSGGCSGFTKANEEVGKKLAATCGQPWRGSKTAWELTLLKKQPYCLKWIL